MADEGRGASRDPGAPAPAGGGSLQRTLILGLVFVGAGIGIGVYAASGGPVGPDALDLARGRYLTGGEKFRQGDLPAAEADLLQSVDLNPADDRAWHLLGDTRLAQAKYAEAGAAYEKAVAIDPKKDGSWLNLARARKLAGALPAAGAAIEKALRLRPEDPAIGEEAGDIAQRSGEFPRAAAFFQAAAAASTGELRANLLTKVADANRAAGDRAAAATALWDAAIAEPTGSRWNEAATTLVEDGQLDRAAEAYAKQAEVVPDGSPWELVGEIRGAQGKLAEAEEAYARANSKGDRVGACIGLARLALGKKDLAAAEAAGNRALTAFGEEEPATAAADLAELLLDLEKPAPAAQLLGTVVAELDDALVYEQQARALTALKQEPEARAACALAATRAEAAAKAGKPVELKLCPTLAP